jgi:hypothetical protein
VRGLPRRPGAACAAWNEDGGRTARRPSASWSHAVAPHQPAPTQLHTHIMQHSWKHPVSGKRGWDAMGQAPAQPTDRQGPLALAGDRRTAQRPEEGARGRRTSRRITTRAAVRSTANWSGCRGGARATAPTDKCLPSVGRFNRPNKSIASTAMHCRLPTPPHCRIG